MKNFLKANKILISIFLLGAFLRFYALGTVPSGFHADEAAFGYNAYSILLTGKDEFGEFLPLVLKSFGDYKGPLYAYMDVPFVALLGTTPLAVRLPSALFGSLTILLIFLFAEKFLKNRKIALISAFMFAILPWHINITRVTGDVTVGMFFALLTAYSALFLADKKSGLWFLIAAVSGALAIVAYAPYRMYVVIILFLLLLFSIEKVKSKILFNKKLLLLLVTVFAIGGFYTVLSSTTRFDQISIFTTPQTQLVMEEQIREDEKTPIFITRTFHNKVVNYSRTLLSNAGEYFTFSYLFLDGGYPQREKIPNAGLFYIWEAPFLLLGLYFIVKRKKRNEIMLPILWISLLFPTFFTFDEIPNVHRNLIIGPIVLMIIAIGIYETFMYRQILKKVIFYVVPIGLSLVVLYELLYFSHQYFVHYDLHRPWYRGYVYKELVADLKKYGPSYEKIMITKTNQTPYIYLLFYLPYSPDLYQKEGSPRDIDYGGFGKYVFVPLDCPLNGGKTGEDHVNGRPGILYVVTGTCVTPKNNVRLLKTINWQDNSAAFKIMEYVSTGSAVLNPEY